METYTKIGRKICGHLFVTSLFQMVVDPAKEQCLRREFEEIGQIFIGSLQVDQIRVFLQRDFRQTSHSIHF